MPRPMFIRLVTSRVSAATDWFPFGAAPLVLLLLAVGAGLRLVALPDAHTRADLRLWTFAKPHYDWYQRLIPGYEETHAGTYVDLQLIHHTVIRQRLAAALQAGVDVPDLVEVEIAMAGRFFRGPLADIGFVDLTDRLRAAGLDKRIPVNSFAPYQKAGRIFGLPLGLHPVALAYRRDLFEEAGIDPRALQTWDDFIRVGRALTIPGQRYMLNLSEVVSDYFDVFLYQRGGGYFNPGGDLILDDELTVDTLCWYVPLMAGDQRIASEVSTGSTLAIGYKAIESGYFLTMLFPDWQVGFLQGALPQMKGKFALMPLPAFEPGGRRTSVWGGTMISITRRCTDPEAAWEFVQGVNLDPDGQIRRYEQTGILPVLEDLWSDARVTAPDPFWSNQPKEVLYAELARQIPARYSSPFYAVAKMQMDQTLSACTAFYRAHGQAGFREFVRQRLDQACNTVRIAMGRNPF